MTIFIISVLIVLVAFLYIQNTKDSDAQWIEANGGWQCTEATVKKIEKNDKRKDKYFFHYEYNGKSYIKSTSAGKYKMNEVVTVKFGKNRPEVAIVGGKCED